MHNYKGQLRRDFHDNTPTKSSWEREKEHFPSRRNQSRHESKYETKQDERYQHKFEPKYENKYENSELSYYQSQNSRVFYDPDRSEKPTVRSTAYMPEEKYMFNELMPLRIKQFDRQEFQQIMRVQIQSKIEKSISSLIILITDDAKPTFLWQFHMRQNEFLSLKNEQKLKVSYSGFPQMLENCFRQCLDNPEYHGQKNNHLLLQIKKGGQGILSVLQSNRYKESVHLYLFFKMASDEDIKIFLANKLITAQDEIKDNKKIITNMENALDQRNRQLHIIQAQLNQLKRDGEKKLEQYSFEERKKMNQIIQKAHTEKEKIKSEKELQLKQLRHKYNKDIDTLTHTRDDYIKKCSEAKQKIIIFQSNQREQTMKINRLEQDMNKYLKQYDNLKLQNKDLSEARYQNEKTIAELRCKLDSLKSQIQDKKTIINSTVQNKETISSQISTLENQSNEQKKQIIKLQTKITELEGEISKLSNTNSELIQKIGRQKQKLHDRVEVIKEQENQLRQVRKKQIDLNRENDDLRYKNSDKEKKIQGFQEQMDILQKKLQDQTSMVVHLQKQLNERSIRNGPYYSSTTYQPSAPYSSINRQLPSQLSANSNISTSRVALSTNNIRHDKISDKYQPNIKRYEQRSKSPIPKRLTQQKEPQEEDYITDKLSAFEQPRPVKFKMSQPRQ